MTVTDASRLDIDAVNHGSVSEEPQLERHVSAVTREVSSSNKRVMDVTQEFTAACSGECFDVVAGFTIAEAPFIAVNYASFLRLDDMAL